MHPLYLVCITLGSEPRASYILSKHSVYQALPTPALISFCVTHPHVAMTKCREKQCKTANIFSFTTCISFILYFEKQTHKHTHTFRGRSHCESHGISWPRRDSQREPTAHPISLNSLALQNDIGFCSFTRALSMETLGQLLRQVLGN